MAAGIGAVAHAAGGSFWLVDGLLVAPLNPLYFPLAHGSRTGQSAGDPMLRIAVRNEADADRATYGQAFGRTLFLIVCGALFFLGGFMDFLWPIWDRRKQALHDKAAGPSSYGRPTRDAPLSPARVRAMERPVKVACVQVEPVVFDREATVDKLERVAAEAAGQGAELVVFPETFVPVYPSSRWAKAFAGWDVPGAKETFARLAQESVAVGSPAERRIAAAARELGIWIVTGVNEVDAARLGTIYNALFFHSPMGELALHHRKLVPTNHERLVWGQGDGRGLTAVETGFGRVGGLICWENYMPLARAALYESGVEIYVASTADDGDAWQPTLVHIARESRAYVVAPAHFQLESAYPDDFPLAAEIEGAGTIGRGGSAILAPDGSYLAGPLYDGEGILYAELDPGRLLAERQRFDPVGHYSRPDVLQLTVRADGATTSTRPSVRSARP